MGLGIVVIDASRTFSSFSSLTNWQKVGSLVFDELVLTLFRAHFLDWLLHVVIDFSHEFHDEERIYFGGEVNCDMRT